MANAVQSAPSERVLAGLKGVKEIASGWVALCPVHDDTTPSLSIAVGTDGRVVMNCHAGCATRDIVAKLGLGMGDLFATPLKVERGRDPDPSKRARLVRSYDYVDADGTLLFQTCRFEPKTFRQRRPDGNGDWIWSLNGIETVLYQLPRVLAAAADGKRVFVVEGEKDAEALNDLGFTATTSPMGAGKWRESYSDALVGADVVILPDNDEPGRAHAEQVAASLTSRGVTVRIATLPDLPQKGDVSDWIQDNRHTIAQLEEIVTRTSRWTADAIEAKNRTRWRLDELWDNEAIMRPPPPIVPHLAWAGRSTLLAAREKAGKSTLISFMTAQVTNGADFLGAYCQKGDVLIIGLEEFVGDTARRLRHFGADATRVHIVTHFPGDPRERPQELVRHIEAVDPLLIILDSLSAYSRGQIQDDNNATQMTAVMQPLSDVAHKQHVALVVVHHARKTDGRSRGSTAITAGTDVVCEFWTPDEDTDPMLRRMRSAGRVPVTPQFDFRFDGRTYWLDRGDSSIEAKVLEYVRTHPGCARHAVTDAVTGKKGSIESVITQLIGSGAITDEGGKGRARHLFVRDSGHQAELGNHMGTDREPKWNQ